MRYIIATHGRLAEGYCSAIKVLTQLNNLYPICAYEEGYDFPNNFISLLSDFSKTEEVIVFTDILGGSVTQQITRLINEYNIHIVAGINLPLILEFMISNVVIDEEHIQQVIEEARLQITYVNPIV